jgi:hypothetical protein
LIAHHGLLSLFCIAQKSNQKPMMGKSENYKKIQQTKYSTLDKLITFENAKGINTSLKKHPKSKPSSP